MPRLMKSFLTVLFFLIFSIVVAQNTYTLSGKVLDDHGHELIGATVRIMNTSHGAVTNTKGEYIIPHIVAGKYDLAISFIGYETETEGIVINADTQHNFELEHTLLNLHEVEVTSAHILHGPKENPLNVETIGEDFLKQNLGGSLMKSLERLPGVSTIGIGSGQSKPVIRGLSFNRVVVMENNIKHEAQQWGADHGLEVDQYAVDRVEVIKGPASLKYGSDAIGGVIDMSARKMPAEHTFGGSVDLTAKSNNRYGATSLSLYGRKSSWYADARLTIADYGDYRVPAEEVSIYSFAVPLYHNQIRNTAGEEVNGNFSLGLILPRFQNVLRLSAVNSTNGLFANAHGKLPRNVDYEVQDASSRDILYPYQKVSHLKVINSLKWELGGVMLSADLAYQHNDRQEWSEYINHGDMPLVFPDSMAMPEELERAFDKDVYSANVTLNYDLNSTTRLDAGLNGEWQVNRIGGHSFIIPDYQQQHYGTYLVAKHFFNKKSLLQGGLRYDYGHIHTQEYYDWYKSEIIEDGLVSRAYLQRAYDLQRHFSSLSWSVGYNYNAKHQTYKVNVGRSFRMPIAKELAADGVNPHNLSFEIGNGNLNPEVSYQLDGGAEFHTNYLAIGMTPFFNYFSNYIYLNPTSDFNSDYGLGNQEYEYTEAKVLRFGGEIHAHYQILKKWQLGLIGEYVYSEQMSGPKKGYTLPFAPPASAIINLKYNNSSYWGMKDVYASLDWRLTAAQHLIVPPEEVTEAYNVLNLSMGGQLSVMGQTLNVALQMQNILNNKYYNHTSFYRMVNVPEPGRNIIINVNIPLEYSK